MSLVPSSLNHPTLPIFSPVVSFAFNPSTQSPQALVASTLTQASPATQPTPSIQSSTTQHPSMTLVPSSFSHPTLPISSPFVSFGFNPSTLAPQALVASTLTEASPATQPTPSIQHPSMSLVPSSFNHPTLSISSPVVSFCFNPSTLAPKLLSHQH